MSYRLRTSWLALLALIVLMPVGACNCNKSSSSTAKKDTDQAETSSAKVAKSDDSAAKDKAGQALPADLYPGMNFGVLDADARATFVDIAKAEVCPCPDAAESLHECLQDADTVCGLAKQTAGLMAMGIQRGISKTDVLDRVAKFVESARKTYEFRLDGVPHKGPKSAPVQIVEFADFQCPHCKAASAMMEDVVDKYGDKIAFYFKQFPLQSHPQATQAAHAALAAHQQGKFWQMHTLLFDNQRSLSADKIKTLARRIGLNMSKFTKDLTSKKVDTMVRRDRQEGDEAGIRGTPAIFIDGRRYMGPNSVEALSQAIDAALEEAQKHQGDDKPADAPAQ